MENKVSSPSPKALHSLPSLPHQRISLGLGHLPVFARGHNSPRVVTHLSSLPSHPPVCLPAPHIHTWLQKKKPVWSFPLNLGVDREGMTWLLQLIFFSLSNHEVLFPWEGVASCRVLWPWKRRAKFECSPSIADRASMENYPYQSVRRGRRGLASIPRARQPLS